VINFPQPKWEVFLPYKDKEKRVAYAKAYGSKWYQRNKEKVIAKNRQRRKRQKKEWIEWKAQQACNDCGFSHPAALDFHHINKDDPENRAVYQLVQGGQYNTAVKEAETKCVCLCANCHRILHWNEHYG
jgi:hypothetical protein